jgi:uncharacterized membrane protein YdfJ with MMPL/SSD domain
MWRIYKQVKGAAMSTGLNVMVNMRHRMTAETNEVITEYLWRSLFTTLVAVFLVCLILSNSLVASLVAISMVLLDYTLLSLSSYSRVKFSVISFACIIMSVGLSVDYLLHMAQECVKEIKPLRRLTTGHAHVKLLFIHKDQIDVHQGNGPALLAEGCEKVLQQVSKTTQDVTQASGTEELSLLSSMNIPLYQRGDQEAQSGAVETAEESVKRDFVVARLGKRAGGGDRGGEFGAWRGEEGEISFFQRRKSNYFGRF